MDYDSEVCGWMWKVVGAAIWLLGNFGNVLTLAVLGGQKAGGLCSTSVYLIALAVSDLIVIDIGLLRLLIIHFGDVDVRTLSDAVCRIHWFVVYCATEVSSWLLVAVAVEQTVSVVWPHKVRVICRPKSTRYAIATIYIAAIGVNAHLLYGVGLHTSNTGNNGKFISGNGTFYMTSSLSDFEKSSHGSVYRNTTHVCNALGQTNSAYQYFFKFVFPWIDLLVYGLVPAGIFIVADTLIMQRLFASRNFISNMARQSSCTMKLKDKTTSLLATLVTLSVIFVASTTPLCVFIISIPYWLDLQTGMTDTQQIVGTIFSLLMYTKHSINFILYALSGSSFRGNVKRCFRRNKY